MKRVVTVWVVGWLLAWGASAGAGEIGFVETFALAEERSRVLDQLVPGTEDYYFYHCLHAQHTGDLDAVPPLLDAWIDRHGVTDRVREIENRQALLTYPTRPSAALDHLKQVLGLRFDHAGTSTEAGIDLPERLDPEATAIPRLIREALNRHPGLSGFEVGGLDLPAVEDLDADQRRDLLHRMVWPDRPELARWVVADLRHPGSGGFGSHPIHRRLLPSQLADCARMMPELLENRNFVDTRLSRLAPPEGADVETRLAALEAMWAFAADLPPVHNSLKVHLLYHLLDLHRRQGRYDAARFRTYLQLPRSAAYVRPALLRDAAFRADLQADFGAVTRMPPPGNDEPLVRDYLYRIFRDAGDVGPYGRWLEEAYARRVFAETRILEGAPDAARWAAVLPPDEARALHARVDLAFPADRREVFPANAPVSLDLWVKNVSTLTLRVFVLNPVNYYREYDREPDTDIDLDGFLPAREEIFHYDASPFRRIRRTFDFPDLREPGVYLVEFIGNGRRSRALIRKGLRHAVERVVPEGHAFTVLDEENRPCPSARVRVAGHEFPADAEGVVTVPFTTRPAPKTMIIDDGGAAALVRFNHLAADYRLTAGFHVPASSLQAGRTARMAIRPLLTLNGHPAPLSGLTSLRLILEAADAAGVTLRRTVTDLEASETREAHVDFTVPENLAALRCILTGRVEGPDREDAVALETEARLAVNGIDAGPEIEDLFLRRAAEGFFLAVLGKNGEAVAGRAVSMSLKHALFRDPVAVNLRTDAQGRIALGRLPGIAWVEARRLRGPARRFSLSPPRIDAPGVVHGTSGEVIGIPRVSSEGGSVYVRPWLLFETRGDVWVADRSDAIRSEGGRLTVHGLPAGDYDLILKPRGDAVRIRIGDRRAPGGLILSRHRILSSGGKADLAVDPPTADNAAVYVTLRNASPSARLHLLATRFVPVFHPFEDLALGGLPDPGLTTVPTPASRYAAGEVLGDEYRYILDRRRARKFPGNMLERPRLLLNPWDMGPTETPEPRFREMAEQGPAPVSAEALMSRAAPAPATSPAPRTSPSGYDFLAEPALLLLNLRPDGEGRVVIPRATIGSRVHLQFIAVDGVDTIWREMSLPDASADRTDRRMVRRHDPDAHVVESRRIVEVLPGDPLPRADSPGPTAVYKTISDVFEWMAAFTGDKALPEFRFVSEWHEMTPEEKQEAYSDHACHELHFFLYHKDRPFFDTVIRPHLRQKREKTFLDQWLLGEDLDAWSAPDRFSRLNILERILLLRRASGPDGRDRAARYVRDLVAALPRDPERFNRLFDAALNGVTSTPSPTPETKATEDAAAAFSGRGAMALSRLAGNKAPAPDESFHRPLDLTREWGESRYYRLPSPAEPDRISANTFWRRYAESDPGAPFCSGHFILAVGNFTEMMTALSVLDLPFTAEAEGPGIVFRREVLPAPPAEDGIPVMVSRHFFRRDEPVEAADGESAERFVRDEFQVRAVYGSRVIVSNPAASRRDLKVRMEIPEGALPVLGGFFTREVPVSLDPYGTTTFEHYFYFPETGRFDIYPVQVTEEDRFVAGGPRAVFNVTGVLPRLDTESWQDISRNGTDAAVIEYLQTHNLNRLDLSAVAFRMRDRDFFRRVIGLLRERYVYNAVLWSYGIHHDDPETIREYLAASPLADQCGASIQSPLLTLDPTIRGSYQYLEYAPLVNPRVHPAGAGPAISNPVFLRQYRRFLWTLSYQPRLTPDDRLAAAAYLLAQDRTGEALRLFEGVGPDAVAARMQRDYLDAYLDVFRGRLDRARETAEPYRDYPVRQWRRRFERLIAGTGADKGRDDSAGVSADAAPALDVDVVSGIVQLDYRHLTACTVSVYPMDVEFLFSQNPFFRSRETRLGITRPVLAETIVLPEGETRHRFPLPRHLAHRDLMVEAAARGLKKVRAVYGGTLSVRLTEHSGRLDASDTAGRPLVGAYVKVYARMHDGAVQFYKDGYTDHHGRFDYAALSTDALDRVERFAMLVLSETHGAAVREVDPPGR